MKTTPWSGRFHMRGAVVEDVRTIFEQKNDATVYIPEFQEVAMM
jgi:hypothetical protein